MKLSPPSWLMISLLVPVLLAIIFITSGAEDALDLGGSEGTELSRALLFSRQPAIFNRVNQPSLYTLLLATDFKLFGPSIPGARLFSLVSATAMLIALGWLLRPIIGNWGSLLAGIFLFSSQGALTPVLSALPGLPAIAWALVSVAFSYEPSRPPHWIRLGLSGMVWACAINLDVSVWMLWPAFLILMSREWGWRIAGRSLGIWTIGFVAASLLVTSTMPSSGWKSLFGLPLNPSANQLAFRWSNLLSNPGLVLAALCGIWQTARHKAQAPLLFAAAWLVTVSLLPIGRETWLHSGLIQFYVPLAILGSVGLAALLSNTLTAFRPGANQTANHKIIQLADPNGFNALGAITIFAFWVGFAVPDFVSNLTQLSHLPSAEHDGLCLSIRQFAPATHWCYTRFPEYAFAGGVLLPLEAISNPSKLFEQDPANESALKMAQRYKPEQLLLAGNVEMQNSAWVSWMTNDYVLVYQAGQKELWVSRSLHPTPIPPPNALLQKLGL